MSVYHDVKTNCRCGATLSVRVAHGVNINRLPEVRDEILAGRFHATTCGACGQQVTIEREFLYSDFDRGVFLRVKPRKLRHRWQAASRELADDAKKIPPNLTKRKKRTYRVVFGMGELREKLIAEDAGLDDRVVELAKVLLVNDHPFLLARPRLRIQLDAVGTSLIDFAVYHDHASEAFRVSLPVTILDRLKGTRAKEWVKRGHGKSLFHLRNDYWVNFWRWSPQTWSLHNLEEIVEELRAGKEVDFTSSRFTQMLFYLPSANHLPSWAKRALRELFDHAQQVGDTEAAETLFEARFKMDLDDEWFRNDDPTDVDTLWDLLRDLPDSNVEGNTFIAALQASSGSGGVYRPSTQEIVIGQGLLANLEEFQDVVRHEVGHAVQEKLDRSKSLVTSWLEKQFGWRQFGDTDEEIDAWVQRMGGYGTLQLEEIESIRDVLRQVLGPGEVWGPSRWRSLPSNHPWNHPGFGPRLAAEKTGSNWFERHEHWHEHQGEAFFVNFYYRTFTVVSREALDLVDQMPSNYAAMSPYEFFAELYALYYDLDDPLRVNVPEDVSQWLEEHVGPADPED